MKFIWEITDQKRTIAKIKKAMESDNFDKEYFKKLILQYPKTKKDYKEVIKILKKVKSENKKTLH